MKSIDFRIFRINWIPDFFPIGSLWLETSATALRGPYVTFELDLSTYRKTGKKPNKQFLAWWKKNVQRLGSMVNFGTTSLRSSDGKRVFNGMKPIQLAPGFSWSLPKSWCCLRVGSQQTCPGKVARSKPKKNLKGPVANGIIWRLLQVTSNLF